MFEARALHRFGKAIGLPKDVYPQENLGKGLSYPFDCPNIVKAFVHLAEQLKPELDKYDFVLSDDRSGHIVAGVLRDLIDHSREAKGKERAQVSYLGEKLAFRSPSTVEYLLRRRDSTDRILVCTEFTHDEGKNLKELTDILDRMGIGYDVAILVNESTRFPNAFIGVTPSNLNVQEGSRIDTIPQKFPQDGSNVIKAGRELSIFADRLRALLI